jgi:hypothetical protein
VVTLQVAVAQEHLMAAQLESEQLVVDQVAHQAVAQALTLPLTLAAVAVADQAMEEPLLAEVLVVLA